MADGCHPDQRENVMSQADTNLSATLSTKHNGNFALGSARLATSCFAWLLITSLATALAQGSEQVLEQLGVVTLSAGGASGANASTLEAATLPSIDSIDADTDVTVFLRSGVPAELRLAGRRRAWTVDPAIRDFKGLQENDWNFDDPNNILGFGELGPEVDIERMVAQIFGETSQVVARAPERRLTLFSRVMDRLFALISTAAIAR